MTRKVAILLAVMRLRAVPTSIDDYNPDARNLYGYGAEGQEVLLNPGT